MLCSLPDSLTKFTQPQIFKHWLKRWLIDRNVKIPVNKFNPINTMPDTDYLFYDQLTICTPVIAPIPAMDSSIQSPPHKTSTLVARLIAIPAPDPVSADPAPVQTTQDQ